MSDIVGNFQHIFANTWRAPTIKNDSFNLQNSQHAKFYFIYHLEIINLTLFMKSTTQIYQFKFNHIYSSLQLPEMSNVYWTVHHCNS